MGISKFIKSIYNLLTFTDIPIWKKLLLFATGGIAWFIIIALIGLGAVTYVNVSSTALTSKVIPHIQASQKLIIKIRGANVSVHNIVIHDDAERINRNLQRAKGILDNVSATINALLHGGRVQNYSDLTGELIQEFHVKPVTGGTRIEEYIKQVGDKSRLLREHLELLTSIKLKGLETGALSQEEKELFKNTLREYDTLTVQSVTVLGKLTSIMYAQQEQHTRKIDKILRNSMGMFIVVGGIAILLVAVFAYILKASITRPLKAITEQIKGLSEGEVDLSKQLTIGSKDEIADLSANFNVLMQTIDNMNRFKKVIEEDDSLEDVYTRLAKVFHDKMGLDEIVIFEVSERRKIMRLVETPFSKQDICCNKEILIDSNICRARKTGHKVSSISYPEICKQFLLSPEKYHICVPIIIGGTTGGVVQFQFDKSLEKEHQGVEPILNKSCIERQVIKAEQFIKESSSVIETKKLTSVLKESAVRDQMTGLYNRRFLEEYVDTLIAGVMRKGTQVGLLMCDLDFFKEVNDKYGHDAGDAVLKETSDIIAKNARASDMVIRFGGEEFLVIVNNAKDGDAAEIAERIRARVGEAKIKTSGGFVQKKISIGYSEFPKDTENFWEAIKYADIALYKAKETGRNRVVRFEKEMWTKEAY